MAGKTPPKTAKAPSPDQFLAEFAPEVQDLAQLLRQVVKSVIPNTLEAVYPGWRLIGYRLIDGSRSVYFAYIAPQDSTVSLGFEYGILLSDPHGILEGAGRQVRHITIDHPDAIRSDLLGPLIREAAHVAAAPRELKRQLLLEHEALLDAHRRGFGE